MTTSEKFSDICGTLANVYKSSVEEVKDYEVRIKDA